MLNVLLTIIAGCVAFSFVFLTASVCISITVATVRVFIPKKPTPAMPSRGMTALEMKKQKEVMDEWDRTRQTLN